MNRFFIKKIILSGLFFLTLSPEVSAAETLNLTLEDAVRIALENNHAITQSAEDVQSAKWQLSAVRRSTGPRLSWSSSLNRLGGKYYSNYSNYPDSPSYNSENSNSFSLSMPVYSGGKLEAQRKAARYNLDSADFTLENTRQQIKWQVAQAYYRVLQYKDVINVQQEEITNLNEHLRNVQLQLEVGTVAFSDVLATNVQIANSMQALNNARGNYDTAVATLNNIMGVPVDTALVIDEVFNYVPYNQSEAECIKTALENRPDARSANLNVKSNEENINAAKSGFRPSVNAVVQGSFSGEGVFKSDHSAEQWSAGFQLSWDIFDNNVTAAQVQQAKAALRKAQSVELQQLETIKLEVHTAYTNLKISELNISVTQSAVAQAQEQFYIAQVRYEEGVDTNLTVMDAQEKLTQTRTNFFAALYSYNTARAQLFKAMGVF